MSKTDAEGRTEPVEQSRTAKPRKSRLDFRPETYFWSDNLRAHILSHIKGAKRRRIVEDAIARNEIDSVLSLIDESNLQREVIDALSRIHPSFLGGEFLPDREENEVEIARVTLNSTLCDVTSVYAKFADGLFHYRIVDEYEGETLTGPAACTSKEPLTLGELIDFLDTAWPIVDVLEMGFEGSLQYKLGCFHAESAFYRWIDAAYKRRVREAYRQQSASRAE